MGAGSGSGRRWVTGAILAIFVILLLAWRTSGQHVDLVVVNESAEAVDFSWQPAPFAEMTSVRWTGCSSHSIDLPADITWRLARENGTTILDSVAVQQPLQAAWVATEVRLDAQGTVHIAPPHEVAAEVAAPYPVCGAPAADEP